ncbi:hypothetical protein V8C44DRAFT_269359 [Trichoderma aethiopicum]
MTMPPAEKAARAVACPNAAPTVCPLHAHPDCPDPSSVGRRAATAVDAGAKKGHTRLLTGDKDRVGGIFRFTARDLRYSAPQGSTADSRVPAGNGRESACVGVGCGLAASSGYTKLMLGEMGGWMVPIRGTRGHKVTEDRVRALREGVSIRDEANRGAEQHGSNGDVAVLAVLFLAVSTPRATIRMTNAVKEYRRGHPGRRVIDEDELGRKLGADAGPRTGLGDLPALCLSICNCACSFVSAGGGEKVSI